MRGTDLGDELSVGEEGPGEEGGEVEGVGEGAVECLGRSRPLVLVYQVRTEADQAQTAHRHGVHKHHVLRASRVGVTQLHLKSNRKCISSPKR